jgi:hypothetical protein
LPAHFATRVGRGVDVEIPIARFEVGDLLVVQRRRADFGTATTGGAATPGPAGPWKWAMVAGPVRPE